MLAETIDRGLREFEQHVTTPATIKRAAQLLELVIGRGFDTDTVREVQRLRLQRIVRYIYHNSPFYREALDAVGVDPTEFRSIDRLSDLPFTTSEDIRNWHRFLCVPEEQLAAVFTTAGTTGEPKRVYYSFADMRMLTNLGAVALRVGHAPGHDRFRALIALPMSHGPWMGWATAYRYVERAGGLPLPVGVSDMQETLAALRRFEPNVVFSSPSHMTSLTHAAAEAEYRVHLDKILLGGEPLSNTQKERFSDYWGAQVYNSYGTTEMGGGQTIMLPECTALHLNDLFLATEIIDSETDQSADEGELVFTTLTREAMPLLRYRSGDRARWADCSCWLPFSAIELTGRLDDMIVAGDMNLYGGVMAETITNVPGSSGRIEIVVDKEELADRLTLRVEGSGVDEDSVRRAIFDTYPELRTNVANDIVTFTIETDVDLGDQLKALKIVDRRPH